MPLPLSSSFNGWNVSMYDSLDTMLLMGLHDEFAEALSVIQQADFSQVCLLRHLSRVRALYPRIPRTRVDPGAM